MKFGKMLLALLLVLSLWISWDLLLSSKSDIRQFEPKRVGHLEKAMWRSYYEKQPLSLFLQLASTLRIQFHAPFWRSHLLAYYASKAAVTFQKGKSREEYIKALPYLKKYYSGINDLSEQSFDVSSVAVNELEWWIIRREPELHQPSEWEQLISQIAAEIYHIPIEKTSSHAELRVQAMIKRDQMGENITENDWTEIEQTLVESWESLYQSLHEK